jgi:hypothetical protein
MLMLVAIAELDTTVSASVRFSPRRERRHEPRWDAAGQPITRE